PRPLLPAPFPYTTLFRSIYASHGSADQVIPVDWARKTSPLLSKLNINHIYEEFPVGHGVAPQNFYSLKTWLQKSYKGGCSSFFRSEEHTSELQSRENIVC